MLPRKVYKPPPSEKLAEFVGVMLGDGGVTSFQITISLGYKADSEYSKYLARFLSMLFHMEPVIHERNHSVIRLQYSRRELVQYCIAIGLCSGNKIKKKIDIPEWVKKNDRYLRACIRGLMDTDGCIFQECHKKKEKRYCYPRISFVSHSQPLRISVYEALRRFDFFPNLRNNRAVTLERLDDVIRYFSFIGTHNPKHRQRFEMFLGRSA